MRPVPAYQARLRGEDVEIRRVEQRDSGVERAIKDPAGCTAVGPFNRASDTRAAETHHRHAEPGRSQLSVFHHSWLRTAAHQSDAFGPTSAARTLAVDF